MSYRLVLVGRTLPIGKFQGLGAELLNQTRWAEDIAPATDTDHNLDADAASTVEPDEGVAVTRHFDKLGGGLLFSHTDTAGIVHPYQMQPPF